ncbi:ABC transporter permease [Paenibacillus beijingensis]|uniref:ABC transporter permease n=1 Tax=Paenibacillus beijingensis TaxID=1126833 RepID=A0A0D5NPZ5_9BACL|nr:ABC-2 family transporter protein [Paenibacillus beijingensis]AJY77384.1 hypothetical protein VN24_26065 [Paenibacillus beijingensis]
MQLYLEYIRNIIQTNLKYRTNFLLGLIGRIIVLFVQYYIWEALLIKDVATSTGNISFRDMTNYITISTIISVLVSNNLIYDIDSKIKSGQIAIDLIKPISYKTYLFCGVIGDNIYRILFELVPVIIIGLFVFHLQIPDWTHLFIFAFATVNAVIIKYLISFIFGILGFWIVSVWYFSRFLEDLIRIFAGAWIPIWFFPHFLDRISNFFPFKLIFMYQYQSTWERFQLSSLYIFN